MNGFRIKTCCTFIQTFFIKPHTLLLPNLIPALLAIFDRFIIYHLMIYKHYSQTAASHAANHSATERVAFCSVHGRTCRWTCFWVYVCVFHLQRLLPALLSWAHVNNSNMIMQFDVNKLINVSKCYYYYYIFGLLGLRAPYMNLRLFWFH